MLRWDRLLVMVVTALLITVTDHGRGQDAPGFSAEADAPALKPCSLLTEKDSRLVRRLVENFKDVEGNEKLLLTGDVRPLLPESLRVARRPKERPTAKIYLLGGEEECDEGALLPAFHDGYRKETATFVSCAIWKAAADGTYSQKVDYSIQRQRTSLLGRTSEEWAELREDCSRTPGVRAKMWIRFQDDGTPYIGQEVELPGDRAPPDAFTVECEARFVFGDAATFRRGETVRLEWTEASMAVLRDKGEAVLAKRLRVHTERDLRLSGAEEELALPMLRAIWDRFVNDDMFANKECLLVCERGVNVLSVTVPKKD